MRANLFWLSEEQWARIEPHLPTNVRGVDPAIAIFANDGGGTMLFGLMWT